MEPVLGAKVRRRVPDYPVWQVETSGHMAKALMHHLPVCKDSTVRAAPVSKVLGLLVMALSLKVMRQALSDPRGNRRHLSLQ